MAVEAAEDDDPELESVCTVRSVEFQASIAFTVKFVLARERLAAISESFNLVAKLHKLFPIWDEALGRF